MQLFAFKYQLERRFLIYRESCIKLPLKVLVSQNRWSFVAGRDAWPNLCDFSITSPVLLSRFYLFVSYIHRRKFISDISSPSPVTPCCAGYILEICAWWCHQMETFSALLAICAGNSPVPGEFHAQRPVARSFDVLFDLRLNKRLSKQSWGWWFETLSRPLWRQRNGHYPSRK